MLTPLGPKDGENLQCVQQGTFIGAESETAQDCKTWPRSSRSSLSCLWKACQIPWHACEGNLPNVIILDWYSRCNILKMGGHPQSNATLRGVMLR